MTESTEKRGRRPQTAGPGERMSLGLKVIPEIKNRLDAFARATGRTQSQEAEARIEQSFRDADYLDQAMALACGADNAGLLSLIGEVLRIVTPHGEWLDSDAGFDAAAGGIVRVLRRLRAPSDGTTAESGPDARIDALLWDLGDTGEDHPGPLTARQRWAAEKRRRLGEALSARLTAMREAVREGMPDRAVPEGDPEQLKAWDRAFATAKSRHSNEVDR
jgi:predicted transcriptional regulator